MKKADFTPTNHSGGARENAPYRILARRIFGRGLAFAVLAILGLVAICPGASAVDRITASVAVTNTAGTTNGQTFAVNSDVRTFTNNVVLSSSQVLTNATAAGSKTNLYLQIALNRFSQVQLIDAGSTNFNLVGNGGYVFTVTPSVGWATVTYSTQVVTTLSDVRVPIAGEASAAQQTNIASLLVKGENDLSTNFFYENATAVKNLVGLTNAQTIAGNKYYTGTNIYSNAASIYYSGTISNALGISGNVSSLTNGVYQSPVLVNPSLTNGQNFGNPFRSPGAGAGSEQFGTGANASGASAVAFGPSSTASGTQSSAFGNGTVATGSAATALGNDSDATAANTTAVGFLAGAAETNSTAVGANSGVPSGLGFSTAVGYSALATAAHQVRIGTATEYVSVPGGLQVEGSITNAHFNGTNQFPVGSDIAFGRYAVTTLANGNNAAVPVGTNVFVEVSGPSGAFTVNGIAGGRDGKMVVLLNQTGFNMTLAHQSGVDSTAANRLVCLTAADKTVTGNSAALLIYSGSASRWIVVSFTQ
jgi:hypothetical protein